MKLCTQCKHHAFKEKLVRAVARSEEGYQWETTLMAKEHLCLRDGAARTERSLITGEINYVSTDSGSCYQQRYIPGRDKCGAEARFYEPLNAKDNGDENSQNS